MPAVFAHENAVFWEFLINCSSFLRFFFGTCWYNIQKKNLEIKQVPKNCCKNFLQYLLNFCNKFNTFCIKISFEEERILLFHSMFCAFWVFIKQKKSKKLKKNNKMKIFLLWNIFQKTISNLSKLTSKIVSILYFLWF